VIIVVAIAAAVGEGSVLAVCSSPSFSVLRVLLRKGTSSSSSSSNPSLPGKSLEFAARRGKIHVFRGAFEGGGCKRLTIVYVFLSRCVCVCVLLACLTGVWVMWARQRLVARSGHQDSSQKKS